MPPNSAQFTLYPGRASQARAHKYAFARRTTNLIHGTGTKDEGGEG